MADVIIALKLLARSLTPRWLLSKYDARRADKSGFLAPSMAGRALFTANKELANRHVGERCFILCTGPSIKDQDLSRLAGELVISVSNAYLHKDFASYRPKYNCVPQITYGLMTEEDVVSWFQDMHCGIGDAEMVLANSERKLVDERRLFPGRTVHYLNMRGDPRESATVDLTGEVPSPQSVSIMASMLALYMGCKEIYLLGTDHDQFLTGKYTYFYEKSAVSGKDSTVNPDGTVSISRYDEFHAYARLWRQYRWLRLVAEQMGATIYNASYGGALDEFERIDYASMQLRGDAAPRQSSGMMQIQEKAI